jgi:hypothetical protein
MGLSVFPVKFIFGRGVLLRNDIVLNEKACNKKQ